MQRQLYTLVWITIGIMGEIILDRGKRFGDVMPNYQKIPVSDKNLAENLEMSEIFTKYLMIFS